ncbi:hypothetical protein [Ktedonobacter robiniae]|uniref:Uncharacterized protein n=1 Tax=Ktedonobacter robiniae TaxID=2778365 RepID=A0ABQ3UTH5_9CHLR|nr:hypothetical protein [Ktedonobacter robiniae]GHO55745.1 hypothetical protein KSB_42200 [Ktedonobacter robiniae]
MEQTILVTGSTSGFGRLIVETLARRGYRVFAGMRAVEGKNAPADASLRTFTQQERLDKPENRPTNL